MASIHNEHDENIELSPQQQDPGSAKAADFQIYQDNDSDESRARRGEIFHGQRDSKLVAEVPSRPMPELNRVPDWATQKL